MTNFKAVVVEDIHANRLVVLAVKEKENEINIRLAQENEVPDFLATRAIKESEAVYVTIKNRETWQVEAGADIQAGVSVGTGEDGKIVEALGEGATPIIGYSINAANAGEVVSYVRNVKGGGEGVPGPQGLKGDKGEKGADGFPTEEQWNELAARVETLEG
ncbi:head fiber protein [Peribacillus butanolivorans]|uniref:head fiber protein n=1 Tax=Peribacillus butanolivorans TaxID=421767 RepID=UPI002E2415FA|nr:head fiber protein [Peribacillus butanolivorans]